MSSSRQFQEIGVNFADAYLAKLAVKAESFPKAACPSFCLANTEMLLRAVSALGFGSSIPAAKSFARAPTSPIQPSDGVVRRC